MLVYLLRKSRNCYTIEIVANRLVKKNRNNATVEIVKIFGQQKVEITQLRMNNADFFAGALRAPV